MATWAGVAATGAAIAWAAPALVGATGSGGAEDAGAPESVVLAAVQRDLSLTADEANARLKREAWAGRTGTRLERTLGDDFAGTWMSGDARDLMVGVTSERAARAVRAAGAVPKLVDRNADQLDTLKSTLDQGARSADRTVSGWFVDVDDNQVVVVAQPGGERAARRLAAARGLTGDEVRVVTQSGAPRPLAGTASEVIGGDPYFIDDSARCSVGFAVQGGFVTAGHCGVPGDTTTGADEQPQGEVVQSTFPGNGDFGFVETDAGVVGRALVNDFEGGTFAVAGSEEAPVGASICRSGSTTGVRCGVVEAKNATVNYPEGAVTGLTQTDVCAEGGDSGGSWLSGDQAQGVTSGGSGDCTVGGTTFFQPLAEILEVNDLTLITTEDDGGAPPTGEPTAPPTGGPGEPEAPGTACEGADSVTGTLDAGDQDVRPVFRSTGGALTACLSGPDGANFDLALQQAIGGAFETVAVATEAGAEETLTFDTEAGSFRFVVAAVEGEGGYTLSAAIP